MGFKFRLLCQLLQDLESNKINKVISVSRQHDPDRSVTKAWFDRHNAQIPRCGNEAVAFLSCLFPQRRVDRVYAIQELRISLLLGRCLGLGTTRLAQLNQWRESGGMDLGSCVQSVMQDSENTVVAPVHEVTLEEIDDALERIASRCQFSSAKVRRKQTNVTDAYKLLSSIVRRLRSWEAKWFVRLILKNFAPVVLPEMYAMLQYHFLLPAILQVQSSFDSAVLRLEQTAQLGIPYRCLTEEVQVYMTEASVQLLPQIGIYIERPAYKKARSIKHCRDLAALRRISLERKYDGEYCQIHVDTSKGTQTIKIFSKSGKDSTKDRAGVHDALKHSLRLGQTDCMIKSRCILEGELLVYNDAEGRIQPFYKLRRYVSRSGRFLGTHQDSRPDSHEHLMIMFYDLLLLDDCNYLYKPQSVRRTRLNDLVRRLPGHADIGTREFIDFSARHATERLRLAFAKSITDRWEGFVLKGYDDPYFPAPDPVGRSWAYCIKLKKDYIAGMGDTVDFAVLGGRYDARDVHFLCHVGADKIRWTSFHVACLENKNSVINLGEKPRFRVVDVLNHYNITKEDILELNRLGQFEDLEYPSEEALSLYEVVIGPVNSPLMTQIFRKPFVLEVTGGGFDRPSNANFHTLRFPRSSKLHLDRSFESTTSFEELQVMAKAADSAPDRESQEHRAWVERLERASRNKRHIIDKSQSLSSGSSTDLGTLQTQQGSSVAAMSPSAFVRMDASEMLPHEYRSSQRHVKTMLELRSEATSLRSRKRKSAPRDSLFGGVHPTKRVRASPPVIQRQQRGLALSPANNTVVMPLRPINPPQELRNVSPTRNRRPSLGPTLMSEKKSQEATPREILSTPELVAASHVVPDIMENASQGLRRQISSPTTVDLTLLTPPVSSPEEGEVDAFSKSGPILEKEPRGKSISRQTGSNISSNPDALFAAQTFALRAPIMYVGERLAKINRGHQLHEILRNAKVAVTYSSRYFLQKLVCLASPASRIIPAIGVVLVRAAKPDDTAEEIMDVEQEIHLMELSEDTRKRVKILFMDWRYLTLFQNGNHTNSTTRGNKKKHLKECFAGALRWGDTFKVSGCAFNKERNIVDRDQLFSHTDTARAEIHAHFEREEFWEELYALDGFASQT